MSWTLWLAFGAAIAAQATFKTVVVDGLSMSPSLSPGQKLVVAKVPSMFGGIHDGDIVVVRFPGNGVMVKRVYRSGGEAVEKDRQPFDLPYGTEEYRVPDGTFYLLGDNFTHSEDSREYGPVPKDEVLGKVILR